MVKLFNLKHPDCPATHYYYQETITGDSKMAKLIPLTQGKFAIVDNEDFKRLSTYKWQVKLDKHVWYARAFSAMKDGKREWLSMHRIILGLTKGDKQQSDHINHNGLDNRRCNLRICTCGQNLQNQRPQIKNKTSKYKGVSWRRDRKFWTAKIQLNKKRISAGNYQSEIDAAKAYNQKAMELFGDFACLNCL